jgi:phosphate transport system permease protein
MREAAVLSSPSDALETPHARTLTWFRLEDAAFHAVTKAAAVAVLLVLGSVIVALVYGALPAFRAFE